jgi:predicted phage tail protein
VPSNGATISAGNHPLAVVQTLPNGKRRSSNLLSAGLTPRVTAVAGRTQVTLTWNAPVETDDVNNYQVWRSSSATTGFAQAGTPTGTTFTVGSLKRRTTYYFRVRAVDTSGNIGPFSATVSARTA